MNGSHARAPEGISQSGGPQGSSLPFHKPLKKKLRMSLFMTKTNWLVGSIGFSDSADIL